MAYTPFRLVYGFQPRILFYINIHHDELRSTQNILRDMQGMLQIAPENIKTVQDRAHFYGNHSRQPRVFNRR